MDAIFGDGLFVVAPDRIGFMRWMGNSYEVPVEFRFPQVQRISLESCDRSICEMRIVPFEGATQSYRLRLIRKRLAPTSGGIPRLPRLKDDKVEALATYFDEAFRGDAP